MDDVVNKKIKQYRSQNRALVDAGLYQSWGTGGRDNNPHHATNQEVTNPTQKGLTKPQQLKFVQKNRKRYQIKSLSEIEQYHIGHQILIILLSNKIIRKNKLILH